MTHPKRTTKLTEKVRQAQLDFATPEIRLTKRARVAAPTTPARQTPPALSTPALTRLSSPRALLAASQQGSQSLSKDDAFELELRESQLEEAIVAPTAASRAPIVASANENSTLRLPGYRAPLVPQKHKKSWIYAYGYRINSTAPQLSSKVYFVCKICHLRYHKACSGIYDTTTSPSTAARHLNTTHQIYNPEKPAALALGYFVLDNAANNDTAIAVVAEIYDFLLVHRRLRCGPHTLNLIRQTLLWGNNQQAYDNAPEELSDE
ncbi:hypothetical protein PtrEW4_012055, partial [Pyrenophora tritici-repentis]